MSDQTKVGSEYDPNRVDAEEIAEGPQYDGHMIDAESAARMEREGENFKKTPKAEGDLDTTGGFTVDKEGRSNNFAVEPEMYVNTPGDLREEEKAEDLERGEELREIKEQEGPKGPGRI